MAILAGVGPMGLGMIDYALHRRSRPKRLVVTDIDDARLARAQSIYTVEEASRMGVELRYLNTKSMTDVSKELIAIAGGGGYDDVFVLAPVRPVVEQGDAILGHDGCMHFFAGPTDAAFSATMNFYNVHYAFTHVVGTTGGNTDDMVESLELMGDGTINPSAMITHVGGLNSVPETTLHLPDIPGGKKLMYTNIDMPLIAIADFAEKGKSDPVFAELARLVESNNGLWSADAEQYLLSHAKRI
jgi:L-sorbose 1-phosphate reductase